MFYGGGNPEKQRRLAQGAVGAFGRFVQEQTDILKKNVSDFAHPGFHLPQTLFPRALSPESLAALTDENVYPLGDAPGGGGPGGFLHSVNLPSFNFSDEYWKLLRAGAEKSGMPLDDFLAKARTSKDPQTGWNKIWVSQMEGQPQSVRDEVARRADQAMRSAGNTLQAALRRVNKRLGDPDAQRAALHEFYEGPATTGKPIQRAVPGESPGDRALNLAKQWEHAPGQLIELYWAQKRAITDSYTKYVEAWRINKGNPRSPYPQELMSQKDWKSFNNYRTRQVQITKDALKIHSIDPEYRALYRQIHEGSLGDVPKDIFPDRPRRSTFSSLTDVETHNLYRRYTAEAVDEIRKQGVLSNPVTAILEDLYHEFKRRGLSTQGLISPELMQRYSKTMQDAFRKTGKWSPPTR